MQVWIGISDDEQVHRRPAEARAGHADLAADGPLHLLLVLLLLFEQVSVPGAVGRVADDQKMPGLPVAAAGRPPRRLDQLSDALVRNMKDGDNVSALNAQLHFVTARSTHNALLAMLTASVLDLVQHISASGVKVREQRSHALSQHRQLVAAIAARQPARVRELMEAHLHDMAEEVIQARERDRRSFTRVASDRASTPASVT